MNSMGFNPEDQSFIKAIVQGNPADAILTARDVDEWIVKLQMSDDDEATNFGLTVNKCLECETLLPQSVGEIRTVGQVMANEVLRIAKARSAVHRGNKHPNQVNLYANVVSGLMAMALRHKDAGNSNERMPR